MTLLTNHTSIITVGVCSSFYLSDNKQDLPEFSLLAGQKAFRGRRVANNRHHDSDVEEAFEGYLFCISEGNELFHIFIFVQTFRS